MPLKEWQLLVRDVAFFIRGDSDVAAADWLGDAWLYPLDWSYQLDREAEHFFPKDAKGIPMREYPSPIGVRYLPSRIAAYALAHWNRWRSTQRESSDREFFRAADWLRDSHVRGRFEHDIRVAGLEPPWISCIAQGEAVSVLTRAHLVSGDARYLEAAQRASHWLHLDEAKGGLLSRLPDGRPFLEEYPGTSIRHVLNGCLYALVGVSDLERANGEATPSEFLRGLTNAVAENIGHWEVNGWSTYDYPLLPDQPRNVNTMTYQVLQVVLLRYLAHVTGDARLQTAADRWSASANRASSRLRALAGKLAYRARVGW